MSLLPQSLRSTYCYASRLQPIASSSRLGYYAAFRSSTSIRSAHAIPRPDTASGFEGVPAPAYNGTIADAKGKQKEVEPPAKASAPRRKIQSKKAAISMTPAALDRLRALVASPTEPKLLRIGVKTRGCAGMAYHLDYVPPPGGRFDEVVEQDGVRVLIDSKALFSIIGSVMDWRDNRLSAGFVFDNPNVVDECGCGESLKLTSPVHWPCGSGPDTRSRYLDDEEFPAVRVTPTPDLDSP